MLKFTKVRINIHKTDRLGMCSKIQVFSWLVPKMINEGVFYVAYEGIKVGPFETHFIVNKIQVSS